MNLSNLAKFILGFTLAIALTIGGAIAASLYLVARLTALPPKPDFTDETPRATTVSATPTPAPTTTPAPIPSPTPTPESGLYRARVTWPEGLTLRESSGYEAKSVGGVAFNEIVVVLEETDNGAWQRLRSTATNQEGWVVGGNIEPTSD
ncbi:MAG: SH3 domain-containing protein [Cyanobacteria bacterium SID2]|nr:SH3 domain-containing protein [Cyanobacteria bacterium SID2]MBP0003462.1 SH3 domain-containing protein [Cyanobacteria bacterium SBC]